MRIGMDFGTTNSGIAHYDGAQLRLLPLDPSAPQAAIARSALYLTHDRQLHFGQEAIRRYYEQNLNRPVQLERVHVGEIELTFAELPTFLRDVYIERDVFSPGRLFLSFKSSLASQGYLGTAVAEDFYLLEDIIALYLYSARRRAEAALNAELTEVVLGRPVRYADDPAQDALAQARMLQAAHLAGFQRVHFAYEPVAAAHSYTLRTDFPRDRPQTFLVFDFGGGTLDISIVRSETTARSYPAPRSHTAPSLTVLATGGIALAGDAFDSRIVRRKLTAPFGEGSHYQSDGRSLPVPAAYYDAFASWQDLLALQQPQSLESLRQIARSASEPARIQALIRLITSHYGLRLFEIAEAAKRQLSTAPQARLQLAEDGLAFDLPLSRREFERLIRPDRRQIAARLDAVLAEADLRPDQIDAVLRTGGSAQIPCFVALLEERFGAEKIRSMDAFSSVTAGLAIIAQRIDAGLPPGTLVSADPPSPAPLPSPTHPQLPRVPLAPMQQLIDLRLHGSLQPSPRATDDAALCLVARQADGSLFSQPLATPLPPAIPLPTQAQASLPPARLLPADERLLLLTSRPRLLIRPLSLLQELATIGSRLESFERFAEDAFGAEIVCHFAPLSELGAARRLLLLSRRAHAQTLASDATLQRLQLSAALPLDLPPRVGDPFALLPWLEKGLILLLTDRGRLYRLPARAVADEGALLSLPRSARLQAALSLPEDGPLVLARADGRLSYCHSAEIPLPDQRPMVLRGALALASIQPDRSLYALTNQRLLRVPAASSLLPLESGERLLTLLSA
ncbi:MAG: Hsp70 family protein [Chloroflexi bacterium]|nr:Hsp70 family protein [Chloroflexota bacterium]